MSSSPQGVKVTNFGILICSFAHIHRSSAHGALPIRLQLTSLSVGILSRLLPRRLHGEPIPTTDAPPPPLGDYESLPIDVNGPAAAAAGAGAGAGGLTRSVASYNLAAGAAAPGWEGGAEPVPDWQYPAPGASPGSGSGAEGGATDAAAEVELRELLAAEPAGQPASLPPAAGYHVLSCGEMYHKVRRDGVVMGCGREGEGY